MTARPDTLADLIEALTALPDLDAVERARRCPELIEAAKGVLSGLRVEAMVEATTGEDRITPAELSRRLGVTRSMVSHALAPTRVTSS